MEEKVIINLLQIIEKAHAPIEHVFTGNHRYDEEANIHLYWYIDEQKKKQEMIINYGVDEAIVKIIGATHSSYIPLKINQTLRGRYIIGRQLLELDFRLTKLVKMQESTELHYDVFQNKKVISRNSLTIEVIKDAN